MFNIYIDIKYDIDIEFPKNPIDCYDFQNKIGITRNTNRRLQMSILDEPLIRSHKNVVDKNGDIVITGHLGKVPIELHNKLNKINNFRSGGSYEHYDAQFGEKLTRNLIHHLMQWSLYNVEFPMDIKGEPYHKQQDEKNVDILVEPHQEKQKDSPWMEWLKKFNITKNCTH